jgi:hypothetical protein
MAHFARMENGIVQEVIVIDNANVGDLDFPESEPIGQGFIANIGLSGEWLQTSYNDNFRGVYAGIGFTYNPDMDLFMAPITEEIGEPTSE